MNLKFVAMAVLKAKDGKREKLCEELLKLISPTRNEEGCLEYILFEDKQQNGIFYMRETFKNKAAFEFHCNTEYFKSFVAKINELMNEPIKLVELNQVSN